MALLESDRSTSSSLYSRWKFAKFLGITFKGLRDLYDTLGYKKILRSEDFVSRYHRGGITQGIIKAYPDDTWSGGALITENLDVDEITEFEQLFQTLCKTHRLWSKFKRADILCGVGQYSVMVLGFPGELSTPLQAPFKLKDLAYISVFGQTRAKINSYNKDFSDSRFGLPESYSIAMSENTHRTVHHSRTLHLVDNPLDSEVFGSVRLEPVWNYLDDLDKLVGGGSEASWKQMDQGLQVDVDPSLQMTPADSKSLSTQVKNYIHGLSRVLKTKGVNLKSLGSNVPGFGPNVEAVIKLISGTTGIPVRRLTGSERGELASSQDVRNWQSRIDERREELGNDWIRLVISKLSELRVLTEPEDYEIVWPKHDRLSEEEKPLAAKQLVEASVTLKESTGETLVTADEIRAHVLNLDPIESGEIISSDGEDTSTNGVTDDANNNESRSLSELSDDPPKDPEWKVVHDVADSLTESLQADILDAWNDTREELSVSEITDILKSVEDTSNEDDVESATEEIILLVEDPLTSFLKDALEEGILSAVNASGQSVLQQANLRGSLFDSSDMRNANELDLSLEFEIDNPRAIEYAKARAALLVKEINGYSFEAIRALIVEGFEEGIAPRVLAPRIRDVVGFREDQLQAIRKVRGQLITGKPGDFVVRFDSSPALRDFPGFSVKIPEGPRDIEWVEKQVNKYARMQHNYRARTIARSENLRSANVGQTELWTQAQEQGVLPRNQKRKWIATNDNRTSDEHEKMNGQVRGIDEKFVTPDGDLTNPGERPNCRCAQGLATQEDIDNYKKVQLAA
jgi:SPP1 gp7 family putative phage head morphogenesis protein